jgi:putative mRNA 3-end processing factor
LSDHADWQQILLTIGETGAARVLASHGHAEPLARYLASQGLQSGVIRTAWEGEGLEEREA